MAEEHRSPGEGNPVLEVDHHGLLVVDSLVVGIRPAVVADLAEGSRHVDLAAVGHTDLVVVGRIDLVEEDHHTDLDLRSVRNCPVVEEVIGFVRPACRTNGRCCRAVT